MGRRLGLAGAGALAVLAMVLAVAAAWPRVGNALAGALEVHDVAALPRQIHVCSRSWQKDDLERRFTLPETRTQFGGGVVVDPDVSDACPPGPCTDVTQPGFCQAVVWVRVGEDAYLDYALQGGP